jgi:hypothetical protein
MTTNVPTTPAPTTRSKWTAVHSILLCVLLIAIGLVATSSSLVMSWFNIPPTSRLVAWFIIMGLVGASIVLIGHGITGQITGFLIDARNKMSLSRLQLFLWTTLILSAFLTIAIINLSSGQDDPLNIQVPLDVWGLLGISTGSLVGAGIIKSSRPDEAPSTPTPQAGVSTASPPNPQATVTAPAPTNPNLQVRNETPQQASVSDLFKGELVGSQDYLELGKVQMFFFTLLVILAYATDIGHVLNGTDEFVTKLPDLSAGIVALLAISHAGYLANKTVPAPGPGDVGPTITGILPSNQIDFDKDKSIVITGINFGKTDPNNTVLLHLIPLQIDAWTPSQIRAALPGSKAAAHDRGFTLPNTVDLVVQDHYGRKSMPWREKIELLA